MNNLPEQLATILTFKLNNEYYGIDVFRVREVIEYLKPAELPGMPDFMKGVIELRGEAIPIVDLRARFHMALRESDVHTSFVILEGNLGESSLVFGAMVDGVAEVIDLPEAQIDDLPRLDSMDQKPYLSGITRYEDHFVLVIDTDGILSPEQAELLAGAREDQYTPG